MKTLNFSKRKLAVRSVVLIILSVVLSFFTWFLLGNSTFKGNEEDYVSLRLTDDNLLENAGDYDDAYFQLYTNRMLIFYSEASLLKLDYTQENYNSQIEYINHNYSFLTEPVVDDFDNSYIISENEFQIGNWHFKVCADGEYPKEFRIIGLNDSENAIAYIDFSDSDLDYLCEEFEPMEECFIDEYVGYDFRD